MSFPIIPNSAAAEEPPLSHANLLEEGGPRPFIIRRTTTKPYNCGSIGSLSHQVFAGSVFPFSATFTRQLLSWCVHWSRKTNVLIILWSNATRFLTTGTEIRDNIVVVAWGNLPLELLGEIGKRVSNRVDILRYRSVCKKWRSSLPSPTRFPLWVPPPPNLDWVIYPPRPKFYWSRPYLQLPPLGEVEFSKVPCVITELSIYRCKGVRGLLLFEEVDQSGKFYANRMFSDLLGLRDRTGKFNRREISLMTSWGNPYSRLSFVSKAYHLRMALPCYDSDNKRVQGQWDFRTNYFVQKMVIISSNEEDVNLSYARASDLTVVALLSKGSLKGRLALLRLGGFPENWVWDTDFCTQVFQDISTYRGRLCTLDPLGRVLLMDYHSLQMTQLSPPWPIFCEKEINYLFEACGNLYLVGGPRMATYKLSLRLQKWLPVLQSLKPLIPFLIPACNHNPRAQSPLPKRV